MNLTIAEKKYRLSPFIPCVLAFVVLFFLRDFVGKSIPLIIFLILSFAVAAFADKSEIVAFCFCCIPVLNAFQSKYAFLICMGVYIIRFVKIKTIPTYMLPIGFLIVWEIMHGFISDLSIVEVFRLFAELLFCCFVMGLSTEDIDFKKIVRSMAFMAVCAYTILLLSQLSQYDYQISALFSGVFRFGYAVDETKMAIGFNPNYLAYICLCCIEGLALLVYKKQSNVFDMICLGALAMFGFLTMSRKFIVCAAVWMLLFSFCHKKRFKLFLTALLVILVVIIVLQAVFPTAARALLLRFTEEDIGGGRSNIFEFFNQQLMEDNGLLFFGVGLQSFGQKMREIYNTTVPHNGLQELLVVWGIPGFLAFLAFFLMLTVHAKKKNRGIKLINYVPFCVMLLNVMVSQMVSSSVVTSCIAIVYICMVYNVDDNAENELTVEAA